MEDEGYKAKKRESATRTYFRNGLLAEGVTQILTSPLDGYAFGLPANGKVAVTGSAYWHQVMKKWREEPDPPIGWRAVAFREPTSKEPCVMMSVQSLGRILAVMEMLLREVGRVDAD